MREPDGGLRWRRIKRPTVLESVGLVVMGAAAAGVFGAVDPRVDWIGSALVGGAACVIFATWRYIAGRRGKL